MAWSTSDRRERLPDDWPDIVRRVKARDQGRCRAPQHSPRCNGVGTDVDHVIAGDDHSMANLQLLSEPCHRDKTARESAERNRQIAALKKRPQEQHPGRI